MMVGAHVFGDAPGVMQFAEILLFKTDRKSLYRFRGFLGHQSDYGTGINAARQKRSERNFRHQAHAHRLAQQIDHLLAGFLFADFQLFREVELPVALDPGLTIFPE